MKISEQITELVGRAVLCPPDTELDREALLAEIRDIYDGVLEMEADQVKVMAVADIEKRRGDHWKANHDELVRKNKVLRERPDLPIERLEAYQAMEAELANANTAWAVLNETHQKQAEKLAAVEKERDQQRECHEKMCGVHDGSIKRLREIERERDDYENAADCLAGMLKDSEAELARYKSSDEAEQCETCEGTGKVESCAEYVFPGGPDKDCPDCTPKAVPLAPEDGPWVVMVYDSGNRRPTYWVGHYDYYTALIEDATKLATHDEASDAAREYRRKYGNEAWPVRLSDVA